MADPGVFDEWDINDMTELFEAWRNRPKGVEPKQPWTGGYDDIKAIAGQTVEVTYYDRDLNRHITHETIARPILPKGSEDE